MANGSDMAVAFVLEWLEKNYDEICECDEKAIEIEMTFAKNASQNTHPQMVMAIYEKYPQLKAPGGAWLSSLGKCPNIPVHIIE